MSCVRSALFFVLMVLWTMPYGVLGIVLPLLPMKTGTRHRIIVFWAHGANALVRTVLGIRYRVIGLENVPNSPVVLVCKHQSAWETIALQVIFPPMCFVLKAELLKIPFLGWGLRGIQKVAINRAAGRGALKQLIDQGTALLKSGYWVTIFPEGTRVAPGEQRPYKPGAAVLACAAQVPVLPVAHNAGEFWPRQAFIKRPGEIIVSIGAPISSEGHTPDSLTQAAQTWIEAEMRARFAHLYKTL